MITNPNVGHRFLKLAQPVRRLLAVMGSALLLLPGPSSRAADAVARDTRLTVALLSFADRTGDPKSAHWRYSLARMVGAPLREAKSIRIYPADACDYGLRKLKLKAGDPIDAAQARKIGEMIEARRVVRGDYRRTGDAWTVTAHVLNVATGSESAPLSATAGDWFDVCDQVAGKILRELGIEPIVQTEAARNRIRFTTSATALEFYSQGYAMQVERKPFAEKERCSLQAVAADPKSAELRIGLAADLLSQGKLEEGSLEIQEGLRLKPESAGAHMALGVLMLFQGKSEAAGKHFREARRLSPDDPSIHARMAEYQAAQGEWPQAVASLHEAQRLNPVSAAYRAQLAYVHARQGERTKELLVDPGYRWFGVPHKQFVFQDDYQAVVSQLNQSRDLALLRLAIKLQPDSALSQFNLAMRLMAFQQLDEARQVLQTALKLDSESWMARFAQGTMAWHQGQPEPALTHLRKAVEWYLRDAAVQYSFARVLLDRGQLQEAREAFRACLKYRPDPKEEADARHAIAVINEKVGSANGLESAGAAGPGTADLTAGGPGLELADFIGSRFAYPSWSPAIYDDLGVVYDDRPEPRQITIEMLTRQAASDPQDAACRFRLGVLLSYASRNDESARRFKEAEEVHRKRLAAAPEDLQSLTGLALCLRGTEEGGRLAKRATELAPAACESWLALAQHQSRLLMIQCCEGLDDLPSSGFDRARLAEALRQRARSEPQSKAIFELGREVLASSLKAIEVAPVNPEPFLRYLAIRPIVLETFEILHRARAEPSLDWAQEKRKILGRFEQALTLCRDSPEQLGALTILRFIAAHALLPKYKNGSTDPDTLKKRQDEVLAPTLARLLESSDSPNAEIAAAACEAYGAVITFIPIFGGLPLPTADVPPMLPRAVRLTPHRCLAWDLRIHYANLKSGGQSRTINDESLPLAVERAKVLKTGRSHALIALCSRNHQASKTAWEQAVELEPENVEFLLNLAAESLRGGQARQSCDAVSKLLDRVADLSYDSNHQQRYPELSAFRLRIFAVNQALAGNPEGARRTVAKILEDHPDDIQAQGLQTFLKEPQ